ncbi:unnamed protein product [Calypogeia fissa]
MAAAVQPVCNACAVGGSLISVVKSPELSSSTISFSSQPVGNGCASGRSNNSFAKTPERSSSSSATISSSSQQVCNGCAAEGSVSSSFVKFQERSSSSISYSSQPFCNGSSVKGSVISSVAKFQERSSSSLSSISHCSRPVCNGCTAGGSVVSLGKAEERSSLVLPSSISYSSQLRGTSGSMSSSVASSGGAAARFRFGSPSSFHGWPKVSARTTSSLSSQDSPGRQSIRVNSSKNGATNAISSGNGAAATKLDTRILEETEKEFVDEREAERRQGTTTIRGRDEVSQLTDAPSCSVPDITMSGNTVTLFNPLSWLPVSVRDSNEERRPLLLYVPGMDGTGQGIRSQLCFLFEAGYDIRCVYIPSSDRSSWLELVDAVLPLVKKEVRGINGENRHLTMFGESFGGSLAMLLAIAVPSLVTRLVLLNPATHFPESNFPGSVAGGSGLLGVFPEELYQVAQDILLPLLVKRNRVSKAGTEDFLSPIDFVPAACAAWRLSMLNDNSGLEDGDLSSITMPTLLIASAKDRILSSMAEGTRLQRLLPNATRAVLPESGHTALFEDSINIVEIMAAYAFPAPAHSSFSSPLHSSNGAHASPVAKRQEAVPDEVMDEMGLILEPWRILTSPLVSGTENLPLQSSEPRRPLLFVGNHTMFGVYDSPILVYELYIRGFRCRGLAHPGHWLTGVGEIFERYGNVKATKMGAYKLLKEGENVLLFPGGAREVCKRKGEEYKLLWKETADFVRMATRHKAIIVPFGALGGDDAYDILYDTTEVRASPIGPFIEQAYNRVGIDPDNIYPVTSLPGTKIPSPVPIPSIERIYFHFAEPVDTLHYAEYINDRVKVQSMYETVKTRVEDSIKLLKVIRSKDPERELPARLMAKLGRLLPEFLPRMPTTRQNSEYS